MEKQKFLNRKEVEGEGWIFRVAGGNRPRDLNKRIARKAAKENEKGQASGKAARGRWKWRTIRYGFHVPPLRMMDVAVYFTDRTLVNFHGRKITGVHCSRAVSLLERVLRKTLVSFWILVVSTTLSLYNDLNNSSDSEWRETTILPSPSRLDDSLLGNIKLVVTIIFVITLTLDH